MPRNELLDAIFKCFRRYNYWSLRSLKAELNQPESYLKQTLESIAVLVRTGPFALTYTLKQENQIADFDDAGGDSKAPEGFGGDSANEDRPEDDDMPDEDEDDVKMEDVL
jgi:transcription initiation factor TFIIF subunit beta